MTQIDFTQCADPERRHDFLLLFDVTDGNPNGDPDAGNMPRLDPETMQGLVSDVCLKRKVRNFVALNKAGTEGYRIYVQDEGIYLNDLHKAAHSAVGIEPKDAKNPDRGKRDKARDWMCQHFYDVRMFGAVMSTGVNCGQVRGPMQLTFARSIEPIVPMDVAVTRIALTDEKEKKNAEPSDSDDRGSTSGTIGRKAIVPYGLYVARGFFNAPFAKQTMVGREDLELFWTALLRMWDLDRSASRGLMTCRGLYIFSHEDPLGNAPANRLFNRLRIERKDDVRVARHFGDYTVEFDDSGLQNEGVIPTTLFA
jgi:CRISPR-associated protein Csd2